MTNKGRLHIGLIGCKGKIATVYLEALLKLSHEYCGNVQLTCGVDLKATAAESKSMFPVFSSIPEMIKACPKVNAVCIVTPPETHYAVAAEAFSYGLSVLLEKAPALSSKECEQILYSASKSENISYAWHAQYASGMQKLRNKLLKEKHQLREFHITYYEDVRNYRNEGENANLYPGAFWDSGINAVSVLTGLELLDINDLAINSAQSVIHPTKKVDTDWDIEFNFGTFTQKWLHPETKRLIDITTDKSQFLINIHDGYILENDHFFAAKNPCEDTMFSEYYNLCKEWVDTLLGNDRHIQHDYSPITIAEMVNPLHGGTAVC